MKRLAIFAAMIMVGTTLFTPSAQAGGQGFFVHCKVSHHRQVDPIVSPGRISAHQHEFFGNTTTGPDSTLQSMLEGSTTCSAVGDTAAYWVPTLLNPKGQVVRASIANAYYRPAGAEVVVPFPQDLRIVAYRHSWHCGTGPGSPTPPSCGGQRYLRASIEFPSCWDGVNLDSPNHLSHLTYDRGSDCAGVTVPKITLDVRYPVHDGAGYYLSSGAPNTLHADFWNTWQEDELAAVVDACLNSSTGCGRVTGSLGS
jgi:hypothetical protein